MSEGLDLDQLLKLARDKSVEGRSRLVTAISDLFCGGEGELSDRERTLMGEILRTLVREVETGVRRALAERLAGRADPNRDLVVALANDEIEVAHPILLHSPLLRDAELVEVVRHRSHEHRLAVAMREEVSTSLSDAIVGTGDEGAVAALLRNPGAALASGTLEALVDGSERVEAWREPLLQRADLTPALARRMYWWVSAALRKHILAHWKVDPTELDAAIEETVHGLLPTLAREGLGRSSEKLMEFAEHLEATQGIAPRLLVQALRQGKVPLFEALFARLLALRVRLVRRFLYEPGGEAVAIACRAAGLEKPVFASIFLLSRQARPGDKNVDPGELSAVLSFYDRVDEGAARKVLRRWQMDPDYLDAIRQLEEAGHE